MARTIQSPGVEIREKDLSLRVQTPVGTNVLVPGFAPQGPTGEPILVTTISEYEQIFGQPGTAAERYLYYSMKEAVNSNANVWCVRLPYGSGVEGTGWTRSYSALFYPMTNDTHGWVIGRPVNYTLTLEEYTDMLRGNFEWTSMSTGTQQLTSYTDTLSSVTYTKATSADGLTFALANDVDKKDVNFTVVGDNVTFTFNLTAKVVTDVTGDNGLFVNSNGTLYSNAGMIIVNTLQTSVNEIGEGYYIGISTNDAANSTKTNFGAASSAPSPNYDSVSSMISLNAVSSVTPGGNYFTIPSNRLEFTLSATKIQGDSGVDCVSEILEKPGFSAYETAEYQDHLSFAVYRIRRSLQDVGLLSLAGTEQYLGSLDANRKKASPSGGVLENAFIEDVVNAKATSIQVIVNPEVSRFAWTTSSSLPNKRVTVAAQAKSLFPVGTYAPNTLAIEKSKQIGNIPLKLSRGLQLATNAETYTIDVIVDAGLSTINAYTFNTVADGLGNFNDESYASLDEVGPGSNGTVLENWKAVANELIYFAEGSRKDCIAIIDPLRSSFVVGKNTKVMDIQTNNFTEHVYAPLKRQFETLDSNYATAYANWVKVNDSFTSKQFWFPFSGYAAAVIARSDASANAWAAPAGFTRGGFSNVLDIAFNPNQKQRDRLYDIPLNPVIFFSGDGYCVYGQKTLQNRPTAFDRLNVRRLFLSLERSVSKTIRYFVFEPNTDYTRSRIVSTIMPAFNYAKDTDGLFDFLIVCDNRNNTPDSIDNGEIVIDIYIKPVRTAEFILVNFIATRTGQEFSEVL